ncbi:phage GP46 family protein [Raoultella planticola]|uniref:phage GP46 family protein n=1 Tax=Raoultella planticola TaxID=575 RepID=UPI002878DF2F|nr:phage GP46 family protein [Raoultella planticola]
MSDISSFWNVDELQADWQENAGVLTSSNDMYTAVLISLFTDGLARADDQYDGTDRRGWWGDSGSEMTIGSRLWLLNREKLTSDVAMRAEQYAEEALQWMKKDGMVREIKATAQIVFPARLNLIIRYLPPDGDWQAFKFFWLWEQLNNAV